ncbi:MAG TPA: cob(I)yrinic acid a,c-diamide adenosyltransferase [Pseudomonadales bacterium]|nr:cob(I)yrinic acid a,c-diamide adenosyltransferase [Pseudomonadales bacterium]
MKARIDRVTTRGGDGGNTGLGDGSRSSKGAARIEAIGTVDEFNAQLGLLRAALAADDDLQALLGELQHRLFDLGGALSLPGTLRFDGDLVDELEAASNALNDALPPLTNFVLPAGNEAAARAHVARTVCRRAERELVRLMVAEPDRDEATLLQWLNRCSDLLFNVARTLARRSGDEVLWVARPAPPA